MSVIRQEDFIASVAGALQYISYYHPVDYITSLAKAYEREQSPAARDAMAQILINSRMCAEGHRPICQDTGIVNAFVKVGMDVRFEPAPARSPMTCRRWWMRACGAPISIPTTSCGLRFWPIRRARARTPKTTRRPCVNVELVKGATVEVTVAAKGGGSEAKIEVHHAEPHRTRWSSGC